MRQFTKKQLRQQVTVTCYGRKETMSREEAIDKYYEAMIYCDGSEAERYQAIYCQLMEGFMNVSDCDYQTQDHHGQDSDNVFRA